MNNKEFKFIILNKDDIIYRSWHIKYFDKENKVTFKEDIYWFTQLEFTKPFLSNEKREYIRAYSPKNDVKLLELNNVNNIKILLKDADTEHKKMIKELTGYGITELDNDWCGYHNKEKYKLQWCSWPGFEKESYEGPDGILAKYVAKKYNCDGFIKKGFESYYRREDRLDRNHLTEFVIMNPEKKLRILYNNELPPEVKKFRMATFFDTMLSEHEKNILNKIKIEKEVDPFSTYVHTKDKSGYSSYDDKY